jgi:NADH:ubiquinone oxidoreductase subunit 5 (subunit L)/multisubunit Na+/H+ antiporter MnhA subunit
LEKDLHEAPRIMTIPLMILSACVVVLGFTEESAAGLLGLTQALVFELPIVGASILAILVGFAPSYFAFYLARPNPKTLLQDHPSLGALRNAMLAGYGFDSLYLAVFVRPFSRISDTVRNIQTGILAKNLWPMLAVLLLLALWLVTRT